MKHLSKGVFAGVIIATVIATGAWAAGNFNNVKPQEFDPGHSFLVQAAWLHGLGCTTTTPCPTGDSKDKQNEGLLLAKTGATTNNASATADLKDVKGTALTELGYDIRKPGADVNDPRGSHCGAGAPRFDIVGQNGNLYFIGCTSPPPDSDVSEGGVWQRLRWGTPGTLLAFNASNGFSLDNISGLQVKSISIVFDEGQDASGAPDTFGLAVLDNVDVNGTLVGRGPTEAG
jgi:hypothetical protein